MLEMMDAKEKLRPASILAIIGGIGLGASIIFPYFSVTFLVTITLSPMNLGVLVWGPLALSAFLSLIAGFNLNASLAGNPKGCLVISTFSTVFSWIIVFWQYQDYYEHSIQEMGFAIPLNFEIGLIIGAISSVMIIISTIMVFSNQSSYQFLVNTYRQQKLEAHYQSRHPSPAKPAYPTSSLSPITTQNFCTNCGKENNSHQRFCVHCGKNLQL